MAFGELAVIGEQRTEAGQRFQHLLQFGADADQGGRAGLAAFEADDAVFPVDVVGFEVGDVGLGAAEMPAALVEAAALGVLFLREDGLMLGDGDGPLL